MDVRRIGSIVSSQEVATSRIVAGTWIRNVGNEECALQYDDANRFIAIIC